MRSGRAFHGVGIPTADALAAGEIDAAKADLIVAGVEDLEPDAALDVQYEVLAKAAHLPSGRLRRELATARAAADTAHFELRCQAAAAKRRVDRPRVLPDGMASLYAVMPAVEATQLDRAIDAAARSAKTAGDPRTLDQLRADALALMGTAAVQTGWIGACRRPHVDDAVAGATRAAAGADGDGDGDFVLSARRDRGGLAQTQERPPPPQSATSAAVPAGHPPPPHPPPPDPRPSSVGGSGSPPAPSDLPDRPSAGSAERRSAERRLGDVDGNRGAPPGQGADLGCVMRVGVIGGRTAHVRVVIPLTTAMGGVDVLRADGAVVGADEPAEVEGYGPIPASVARALAAGGPWARMVTDPVDRTVLEVSSDRYEPPPAMAALVRAREPECVSPSCGVPSDSCDLHHRIPWPVGPTSVTNLDPGCRRDHVLLTHGGWGYVVDAAGCRTWTTAAGLVYVEDTSGNLTLRKPTPNPIPPPPPKHSADEVRRREDGPPPF